MAEVRAATCGHARRSLDRHSQRPHTPHRTHLRWPPLGRSGGSWPLAATARSSRTGRRAHHVPAGRPPWPVLLEGCHPSCCRRPCRHPPCRRPCPPRRPACALSRRQVLRVQQARPCCHCCRCSWGVPAAAAPPCVPFHCSTGCAAGAAGPCGAAPGTLPPVLLPPGCAAGPQSAPTTGQ